MCHAAFALAEANYKAASTKSQSICATFCVDALVTCRPPQQVGELGRCHLAGAVSSSSCRAPALEALKDMRRTARAADGASAAFVPEPNSRGLGLCDQSRQPTRLGILVPIYSGGEAVALLKLRAGCNRAKVADPPREAQTATKARFSLLQGFRVK